MTHSSGGGIVPDGAKARTENGGSTMAYRITPTTQLVLRALADGRSWGYRICRTTRLESGIVYPILRRLTAHGLIARIEEVSPPEGRPPRRYYDLTEAGRRRLAEITPYVPDSGT